MRRDEFTERMIESIVDHMLEKGIIEEKCRAIICYGLDLFISSVISLTIFLTVGWVIGQGSRMTCLLAAFIPIQSFGGGYHCQTHFKCWMLTACGLLATLAAMQCLSVGAFAVGAAMSAFPILKIAPVRNEKAHFSDAFGEKMHRIVSVVYVVELSVAGLIYSIGMDAKPILGAVILAGVSIVCAVCCLNRKSVN